MRQNRLGSKVIIEVLSFSKKPYGVAATKYQFSNVRAK